MDDLDLFVCVLIGTVKFDRERKRGNEEKREREICERDREGGRETDGQPPERVKLEASEATAQKRLVPVM